MSITFFILLIIAPFLPFIIYSKSEDALISNKGEFQGGKRRKKCTGFCGRVWNSLRWISHEEMDENPLGYDHIHGDNMRIRCYGFILSAVACTLPQGTVSHFCTLATRAHVWTVRKKQNSRNSFGFHHNLPQFRSPFHLYHPIFIILDFIPFNCHVYHLKYKYPSTYSIF